MRMEQHSAYKSQVRIKIVYKNREIIISIASSLLTVERRRVERRRDQPAWSSSSSDYVWCVIERVIYTSQISTTTK